MSTDPLGRSRSSPGSVMMIMKEEVGLLFIGDDWAEAHHDVEIEDDSGRLLARKRLPEGLAGITRLHELVAEHLDPEASRSRCWWGSRRSAVRGCRRCSRPAIRSMRSTRCRWPVIGSDIDVGGEVRAG